MDKCEYEPCMSSETEDSDSREPECITPRKRYKAASIHITRVNYETGLNPYIHSLKCP